MKTTSPIGALFGRSPFKPIQQHMAIVQTCLAEVPALFRALAEGEQASMDAIARRIDEAEHQADSLKNRLRSRLPRGLFMPVDRRDLLSLLDMQDSMADVAQDIAELLRERNMPVPESMKHPLRRLAEWCVETAAFAATVIDELDQLLEAGFRGKEATQIQDRVLKLNQLEEEADEMERRLIGLLFSIEDDLKPVDVMFWYQIIHWVGDIADYGKKAGNRVLLLIAE